MSQTLVRRSGALVLATLLGLLLIGLAAFGVVAPSADVAVDRELGSLDPTSLTHVTTATDRSAVLPASTRMRAPKLRVETSAGEPVVFGLLLVVAVSFGTAFRRRPGPPHRHAVQRIRLRGPPTLQHL